MKTKRKDSTDPKIILAAMVADKTVCSRISSQWPQEGLFEDRDYNLIGSWCVKYHEKYGTPPNGQIESIFDNWAERADEPRVKGVERKLAYLSDLHRQGKEHCSDYVLDMAGRYFMKVRLRQEWEHADDELDRNEVDQAFGRMSGLAKVELGMGSVIKPAEDYESWRASFDSQTVDPLFAYPGKLNAFLGPEMVRDNFVAFMAPDKSWKSFYLMDAAFRAVRNRRKVAYFECGDLGRDKLMRRMGSRAARRPVAACQIRIPVRVSHDGKTKSELVDYEEPLSPQESYRAFRKLCRGGDRWRLSCHANSSINLAGITSILRDWEREEFTADVVIIDYADILAPPIGVRETLDQIDDTWKHFRRLSQEFHCLALTATQSNAAAYSRSGLLGRRHFSGRKTKLAHVRAMVGLNVSEKDRKRGVTRINWIVRGEGENSENHYICVAGCPAIGNPVIKCEE